MDTTVQTEVTRLVQMLVKNDIPFEIVTWSVFDKPCIKIASPNDEDCVVDAVCHHYSYGGSMGLLEVMGTANANCPNDDVVGWLTAEEAFQYFVSREK